LSATRPIRDEQRVGLTIPGELLILPQWLAWWSVIGEGVPVKLPGGGWSKALKKQEKPHKLPIIPQTGRLASTTKSTTWSSFTNACAAVQKWSVTGIGFVFTGSDLYSGVDIDNCRNPETGEIAEWAWVIIRALDSYTEISPSGTGVHIIVLGQLPTGCGNQISHHGGKVEMFSRDRYFTFTGILVAGTPTEIRDRYTELLGLHSELFAGRRANNLAKDSAPSSALPASDAELIAKARRAKNGAKFERLWSGQWEGDYPSQSEADSALCCLLAFWTGNDPTRMDSLFRQSGLMRDKWVAGLYAKVTIEAAVAVGSATYQPGRRSASPRRTAPILGGHGDKGGSGPSPDLLHFPYTDTGNAERLVLMHGSDLRFCMEMKKWLAWDGRRWTSEDSRAVKRLFKNTIREMYRQAAAIADKDRRESAEKHARQSEAAAKIRAALECAECEAGIGVSANALDTHPFLLNCLNGTIDLQTGKLRVHDRRDLITKIVRVHYRDDATCPLFLRFLHRIMGDNCDAEPVGRAPRLVTYLQKCFGHSLTANVSEKAIFCFFGSGNNGKTTLLEIIRFILTEYSAQVLIDSLMAHQSRESNTSAADLADLRGARFVTTSEAEEGQKLAVGKIKYLTPGMGEIKACRKYENPISFAATHKLFLDANHKPVIRGGEKAIWNRLKPIPFVVTVPPEEIDKSLLEKLKAEAEGILAWMVEGCLQWIREGLGDPPEVAEASAEWQAESDRFRVFIAERYVVQAAGWVPVLQPWSAYGNWCDANREPNRLTKTAFDAKLAELGCRPGLRNSGKVRAWIGIRVRNPEDDSPTASDKVTRSDAKL
jgi:putative DNA primase/helicase